MLHSIASNDEVPYTTPSVPMESVSSIPFVPAVDQTLPEIAHPAPTAPTASRRSDRGSRPPMWLADFVVPSKKSRSYPISTYVCYDHLSSSYKLSLIAFSAVTEPRSLIY